MTPPRIPLSELVSYEDVELYHLRKVTSADLGLKYGVHPQSIRRSLSIQSRTPKKYEGPTRMQSRQQYYRTLAGKPIEEIIEKTKVSRRTAYRIQALEPLPQPEGFNPRKQFEDGAA